MKKHCTQQGFQFFQGWHTKRISIQQEQETAPKFYLCNLKMKKLYKVKDRRMGYGKV